MGSISKLTISSMIALASIYATVRAVQIYEPPSYSAKERQFIQVQNKLTSTLQTYNFSVQDQKRTIDSLIAQYPEMSSQEFDVLSEKNAQGQRSNYALGIGMFSAIVSIGSSALAIARIKPAVRDFEYMKTLKTYEKKVRFNKQIQ
jgi:hypothetical protein